MSSRASLIVQDGSIATCKIVKCTVSFRDGLIVHHNHDSITTRSHQTILLIASPSIRITRRVFQKALCTIWSSVVGHSTTGFLHLRCLWCAKKLRNTPTPCTVTAFIENLFVRNIQWSSIALFLQSVLSRCCKLPCTFLWMYRFIEILLSFDSGNVRPWKLYYIAI